MRLTLVNGVSVFDGKQYTGATPGEFLAPANDQSVAIAAE